MLYISLVVLMLIIRINDYCENNMLFYPNIKAMLSAEEISDLYRKRWQIELFFKWIKQHLHVKVFYSSFKSSKDHQREHLKQGKRLTMKKSLS